MCVCGRGGWGGSVKNFLTVLFKVETTFVLITFASQECDICRLSWGKTVFLDCLKPCCLWLWPLGHDLWGVLNLYTLRAEVTGSKVTCCLTFEAVSCASFSQCITRERRPSTVRELNLQDREKTVWRKARRRWKTLLGKKAEEFVDESKTTTKRN